ncbi:YtxH domain-containing protein [Bacillus sp. FJAT-45350]|uniref:YtxH domain-containing protein n=1 Tax=Bacillus sp. FJAT-45350 TaxID=2011014 RepID=UPI000BB968FD|nr:YtxH domain-containing protein [Bacillus sp. FJAT-45350]
MDNQKELMVGAVVGGVVGAATALLTTPKSGQELRADISNRVEEGMNKTEELTVFLKEKITELSALVSKSSGEISETALEQIENVLAEAKEALEVIQNREDVKVEDFRDVIKEIMEEEMKAGKEINNIVREEMKSFQERLNEDIVELKEKIK